MCDEVDPTHGKKCVSTGVHADHLAFDGVVAIRWPNEKFVRPPESVWGYKKKSLSQQLAAAGQRLNEAMPAVRNSDPDASRSAHDRASAVTGKHKKIVLSVLRRIGVPTSARDIGVKALEQNDVASFSSAESIRRRTLDLVSDGILEHVTNDGPTGALVWFVGEPVPTS